MKIAITGATGHVGVNMCRYLQAQGHEVRALYRSPSKKQYLKGLQVAHLQGDIMDIDFLKKAFTEMEVVIHLAAKISIQGDPDGSVMRTNVMGVRNVVEACLHCGIKKLIHFSSIQAFKFTAKDPIVNEQTPPPDEHSFKYDYSKILGEQEVLKGVAKGLNATILNPTGIIGSYDFAPSLTGQFFLNLYHKKLPTLMQGGYDWIDVRDLCVATEAAIEQGKNGERYLLSGHFVPFKKIAAVASKVTGKKLHRPCVPVWMAMMGLPFFQLYAKLAKTSPLYTYESLMVIHHANDHISHQKASRDLGFAPRPFEETVKDIYAWFEKEGKLK